MTTKFFYIYKTTNKINGKYYIGMHTASSMDNEYLGSGKILKHAIRKYGRDSFVKEILTFAINREVLIELERSIVTLELLEDPQCMNLRLGGHGGGGWTVQQQKENAKRSRVKQEVLRRDPEWVFRKSKKLTTSLKDDYASGKRVSTIRPHVKGWKHSPENIERQKVAFEKSCHQQGDKNSAFGTIWITNGFENKKISKDSIVPPDWRTGRVMKPKENVL